MSLALSHSRGRCDEISEADILDAGVLALYAVELHGFQSPTREGPHHGIRRAKSKALAQRTLRSPRENFYVPSDHDARYSSCSGVSLSIWTPMDSSLSLAIWRSMASGTTYTPGFNSDACFIMYSAESAWLAKLMSITEAGWPSAAARLMRRPSPSK